MIVALALALALACATPAPAPAPTDTAADTAAEPVPELTVDIPSPAWSAEEAAAFITATFAGGLPEPITARAQVMALFDHRDPYCPGGLGYALPGNFEGCLSASGWRYAGVLTYDGPDDPSTLSDFQVQADSYIISATGDRFIGAGELSYTAAPSGWSGVISGQWSYPPAEGWMHDGEGSAVLRIDATASDSGWSTQLDGGVYLDGVTLNLTDLGAASGDCGGEPTGTIELRDPSGYSYRLSATCGCGTLLWADGAALGDVCVSAAAPLAALAALGVP